MAASIKGLENGGWSPWANAARYELEKKNSTPGIALVDKSISIKETWLNDFVKAQLLAARGNYKEALPLAQKAKELGDKEGDELLPQGRRRQRAQELEDEELSTRFS